MLPIETLPSQSSILTNHARRVDHTPHKLDAAIQPLLQEAEKILEELGPVPPLEGYMRKTPSVLADSFLSGVQAVAKRGDTTMLYMAMFIPVSAVVSALADIFLAKTESKLNEKIALLILLCMLIPSFAQNFGSYTLQRHNWLSLHDIAENLVSTLKLAEAAAEGETQQPSSLARKVISDKVALQALKERIAAPMRAMTPEDNLLIERLQSLLEQTALFCRNSPIF